MSLSYKKKIKISFRTKAHLNVNLARDVKANKVFCKRNGSKRKNRANMCLLLIEVGNKGQGESQGTP